MTYEGMFDEINCMQNLKELKKELKKLKEDKTRGQNDLEKTIDVLKTDNSIAEWHIIKLKNEIKELKGKLNDEGKIKIT
jgi:hypothetical protein|tara:strand:- start:309 stop:545 length:237 start_codon:yes stop_codon:yes gene_type:complete